MKKKSNNQINNLWTISYCTIVFINALAFINFNMSTSGMPAVAASLKNSNLNIGLVTTVCAISSLVCRPASGFFSDKYSSLSVAFLGLVLMTVGPIVGIFTNSIICIYLLRCMQGLGWGMASTACAKVIVITSPPKRISEAIGYSGAISSICAAVSPSLGILIFQNTGKSIFMLITSLSTTIALLLILPNKKRLSIKTKAVSRFHLLNCFEKKAIIPAIFVFLITSCYSPMITFIAPYSKLLGINNSYYFFICYAITTVTSRPITGKLVDKHNPLLFGLLSFLSMSFSMISLFIANSIFWLIVSGLLAGIGTGIGINTFQTMAVVTSNRNTSGKAMATFLFGFDFGMAIGSALAGLISDMLGLKPMFAFFSILSLIGLILISLYFMTIRKHKTIDINSNG